MRALKKRLGELKGMQKNLTRDLQDTDREKMGLLRERETLLVANNNPLAKRNEDRLRIRCQSKMDEVENAKKWVLADRERLVEIAAEMKEGNDKLYNTNKSDITKNHERLKVGQDEKLALSQRLAVVKQEIRNHQLRNMVLEETIDEQFDKQIEVTQKSAKTRKQIARTMKKTQTYLVDVERLLREKLSSLQSQDIEMRRLASEREIVEAKRTEAFKATIKGENQRINMRLHFEREQAERDREQNIKDQVREGRRQTVENLGTHI